MKEFNLPAVAATTAFVGLLAMSAFAGSFTIIDTGERGVVLSMGRYSKTMDEGLNFKTPFVDDVIKMNVRDVNFPIETEVSSSDMQTIKIKAALIYSIDPKKVGSVYQNYRGDIQKILVRPTLLEITNAVIAQYPIESFVEKRPEISKKIADAFIAKTADSGIIVKSLLITEHDFSDQFNASIESKKVAEQGALKAKYDFERVRLEAQAQIEKQKSLNEMVLKEKAIDKWDGKLPTYMSSSDSLPFIMSK